jgi:hypothetical protein
MAPKAVDAAEALQPERSLSRALVGTLPLTPTLVHLAPESLGFGRHTTVRRHCRVSTLIHLASEPLGFGRRGTVRRHCSRPASSPCNGERECGWWRIHPL